MERDEEKYQKGNGDAARVGKSPQTAAGWGRRMRRGMMMTHRSWFHLSRHYLYLLSGHIQKGSCNVARTKIRPPGIEGGAASFTPGCCWSCC